MCSGRPEGIRTLEPLDANCGRAAEGRGAGQWAVIGSVVTGCGCGGCCTSLLYLIGPDPLRQLSSTGAAAGQGRAYTPLSNFMDARSLPVRSR